jgi:hypothetical protein
MPNMLIIWKTCDTGNKNDMDSVWNKILWVDRQLGCLHKIYHGPKEMLMAPSLSDTGNMGPVWGGLILKNLKQNPAFWVSFELKIRPQIFINYIQHF